ncbi:phenylalanine--tRNA ligase subunit alpha, partial [Candidatus Saccharibacteria bacterium]|nr:phenylalanine--tRNA ligase subunit alpha [Candidatus Saccharibacteria bacterium]NIV03422.1 phenylalanine--tRNA ligase subunit alpha [Calditrichia bacterium]NIV71641.1 phenylalanine--tRNA ligase subunit alpha [Calditrichia bacterium]NIV98260.1 phenylalanine--tRNA ligase subunit alpha [Candidatus Saccharibacteria bacterium]NIW78523.1 phenylalanine--tRNA ligase subunit alpha [Calditrichia bacterium]
EKEKRPEIGKELNQLRALVETTIKEKQSELITKQEKERIDLTLPGRPFRIGR